MLNLMWQMCHVGMIKQEKEILQVVHLFLKRAIATVQFRLLLQITKIHVAEQVVLEGVEFQCYLHPQFTC